MLTYEKPNYLPNYGKTKEKGALIFSGVTLQQYCTIFRKAIAKLHSEEVRFRFPSMLFTMLRDKIKVEHVRSNILSHRSGCFVNRSPYSPEVFTVKSGNRLCVRLF